MEDEKTLVITEPITLLRLKEVAQERYGDLVKAVVDIKLGIMVIGGEMHADEEAILLERGSLQDNLWGINLYLDKPRAEMIEYDSMINIRPRQNNRSRGVEEPQIRGDITKIVQKLII